jgi:uncharacterized membrane protein
MTETRPQVVELRAPTSIDLSKPERSLSLAVGTLLLVHGLRQGGLAGLVQSSLGAAAAWRGYQGRCPVTEALARRLAGAARQAQPAGEASKVISRRISIALPRAEVYDFCREPQNIGPLIPWVDELEQIDNQHYEWRARGPDERLLGCTLQRSEADDRAWLRWSMVQAGPWEHDIVAEFSDSADEAGTDIKVIIACKSTLGVQGHALASLISKFSDKALLNLLRAIKQQLETGEVNPALMGDEPVRDFLFIHPASDTPADPGEPREAAQ